ncbi:hypothetical protein VTK73DRAFT_237 [Phialemonium thermophilum]|uniref:Uncharacterized protein n=1 Tax=Phialemonium thermophilum TaxID=223376 RepID=A0ABR3XG59_9PEZI
MGRLGPLTSQALGRSPYDDVVPGEGESDPREPLQMWDEKGRPVNPETNRINKDIVRSHNEVMLVIGVAEPENGGLSESQALAAQRHHQYEETIGMNLLYVGRIVEAMGSWGINGTRHRILLYKRYAHVPFYQLYKYERSQQPLSSSLLSGFPSFLARTALKMSCYSYYRRSSLVRFASDWVQLHLTVFGTMQQLGIIPSSQWLPSLGFFIPFTSSSPISAPPPMTAFTVDEMVKWIGALALNCAPLVGVYVCNGLWASSRAALWLMIRPFLPIPHNATKRIVLKPDDVDEPAQSPELAPSALRSSTGEQPRNAGDITRDEAAFRALEGRRASGSVPLDTIRRQSTISARGDEEASDDEETEVAGATLISFDVEASESTDVPPGVWSAELRPNVTESRWLSGREPVYRDNTLTRLPSTLAIDVLSSFPPRILTAPLEAFVWRLFARSYLSHRGLPLGDIYEPDFLQGLPWTAFASFLGMELIHMLLESEIWAAMTLTAQYYRMSEEEWKERYDEGSDSVPR